jgi:hypothetical protein
VDDAALTAAICSFVHASRRLAPLLVAERRSVASVVSVNIANGRIPFSALAASRSPTCDIAELQANHDAKRTNVTKIGIK